MMRHLLIAAAALALASPALAQPIPMSETEQAHPAVPPILSLREQAVAQDAILIDRLETVAPAIMRRHGVDMWVLVAREYMEDPVVATMLDATSLRARRRTILVFYDPGQGKPVERLTVSRYGLGEMFKGAWSPEVQPDQWKALADLIAARNPRKIALDTSKTYALADGLTHSQYEELVAALSPELRGRIVSGQPVAVDWMQTRTAREMALYPSIVRMAHAVIGEAFSPAVITPGKTTADDVRWWMRQRLATLGLPPWFHPSVDIQRQGAKEALSGDTVIQKGDLLWTDFGLTYLRLNTDTQHNAYVLKDGETDAPAGLKAGLAAANATQDALIGAFRTGDSGNVILARALATVRERKLGATIYSHPIGYQGHGLGSAIGMWDNQRGTETGEIPVPANTAWSVELGATASVPEWGGQAVRFRLEENAYFDGARLRFIDGRQTALTLIDAR